MLTPTFPGIFVATAVRGHVEVQLRAAAMWRPDGVLIGRGAARLTYWRDLHVPTVAMALPNNFRARAGIDLVRRRIPPEWRTSHRGINITRPALTTLDLVEELDGAAISKALHAGVSLTSLHEALDAVGYRRYNQRRRALLRDYRGNPWSEAEQELHRLMRQARIKGWIANYPMLIGGQQR